VEVTAGFDLDFGGLGGQISPRKPIWFQKRRIYNPSHKEPDRGHRAALRGLKWKLYAVFINYTKAFYLMY
jgi:hypothetical protein